MRTMFATIEIYFPSRGFGFAKATDSAGVRRNIFFHINDIITGDPVVGATIQYDERISKKGPAAKNVRVVSAGIGVLAGGVQ
jgi:cold shock CspA family protein